MDIFFGQDPLAGAVFLSTPDEFEKSVNPQARNYAQDAKALGNTAVDVKELPESYVFIADMPGLKSGDIKVSDIQKSRVNYCMFFSVIHGLFRLCRWKTSMCYVNGGERKREEATNQSKYLRMERPSGKFLRKFTLPSNANVDSILASCTDGLLTVTVPKIPPPEPHKPKTTEGKVG
ncbi:hypothetical protein R1flu_000806 [Riccia fluitans]|uniref:SHSP domain-containing protein n=1 Tax=Riccia fluitans TaxID=41844 RepID=A0ABD1Y1H4_9MARC